MFMNGTELVGLIGVYVDDFLVAGCDDAPVFSAAQSRQALNVEGILTCSLRRSASSRLAWRPAEDNVCFSVGAGH